MEDQKTLKAKSKVVPRVVGFARLFGTHIPAAIRLDPERANKWIVSLGYDWSAKFLNPLTTRSLFQKHQGVWPLEGIFSEVNVNKPSFFIPAPWNSEFCCNTTTTLLSDVKELCQPLHIKSSALDTRAASQLALTNRTVVAYGTARFYRIYELEELEAAWKAAMAHVRPEHPSWIFGRDDIQKLRCLLKNEYANPKSVSLRTTLELLDEWNRHAKWERERVKSVLFDRLDENQKSKCHRYFRWMLFASLLMRGWTLDMKKLPLARGQTRKVKSGSINLDRLTYAIAKILQIQQQMNLHSSSLMRRLPLVTYKFIKKDDSEEEDVEEVEEEEEECDEEGGDEGDEEGEEEKEENHSKDEEKEEETGQESGQEEDDDSDSTLTGKLPCSVSDEPPPKCEDAKKTQGVEDAQKIGKLSDLAVQCEMAFSQLFADCNSDSKSESLGSKPEQTSAQKSEEGDIVEIRVVEGDSSVAARFESVVAGEECIRLASNSLIRSAAHYLNAFFNDKVSQLPLSCIEHIS